MKKIISALFGVVVSAAVFVSLLTGCTSTVFDTYFNDFTSTAGFSSLEKLLTLPEDVTVEGYFEKADRFVTKKKTGLKDDGNKEIYLYGIASRAEVLIEPSFLSIHDLNGDDAIVSRISLDNDNQIVAEFGLIRIFGKNLYSDMTSFTHNLASNDALPIRFTGDYIAILGDRYGNGTDKFTFYDRQLNDVFRVTGNVFTNFMVVENHVVAYPNTTLAEFYDIKKQNAEHFLIKQDDYIPFSDEDIASRSCDVMVNYLGNGWFLRTATASSRTSFAGFNVKLSDSESYPYVRNVSDRYDANAKTAYNNQAIMPVLAVNKYNNDEMRDLATYYNQIPASSESDKKPVYQFPVYPVSELVRDGYTIVYTYYYIDEATKAVDISFALLEGTARAPIVLQELYMPLLFVDGVGFEVDSPYFSPVYYQAGVYDKKGKLTVLERAIEDYSYASVGIYHGGAAVVNHVDLLAAGKEEATFEAYFGTELVVSYGRYKEFTPYFSGVATATVYNKKTGTRTYYSVNEGGGETLLESVYSLKNGVFVTEQKGKDSSTFGLATNAGTVLLTGKQYVQVYEMFLKNGQFMESLVFSEEGGRGVIYQLK